jgi:hypothetical protein
MKSIKVSELTGAALDWAVAQIEKPRLSQSFARKNVVVLAHGGLYAPTIDWSQGGPIIEREEISVDCMGLAWTADISDSVGVYIEHTESGPTPLIAAMRCYVASKLGDTIEVPEGLF